MVSFFLYIAYLSQEIWSVHHARNRECFWGSTTCIFFFSETIRAACCHRVALGSICFFSHHQFLEARFAWGTHEPNIPNPKADPAREESELFCGGKRTRCGAFLIPKTLEPSIPSPINQAQVTRVPTTQAKRLASITKIVLSLSFSPSTCFFLLYYPHFSSYNKQKLAYWL